MRTYERQKLAFSGGEIEKEENGAATETGNEEKKNEKIRLNKEKATRQKKIGAEKPEKSAKPLKQARKRRKRASLATSR